jgi:hypothetical protein
MATEILPFVNAIIGAVNLVVLIAIAFHGGRWMGKVEVRLDHLEKHNAERRVDEQR